MHLLSPQWLLLLPAFVLLGWMRRDLQLFRPLRIICLGLIVLLLTQPRVRMLSDGLELWVLVDQSVSTDATLQGYYREWESLLRRSMNSADRLFIMDYASESIVRGEDETLAYSGRRERSRLAAAIRYTLLRVTGERPARILVLSDGYSTEPLTGLADTLHDAGIPLDFRLPSQSDLVDYRVAGLSGPTQVRPGEPFLLEARVEGSPDQTIPWQLFRDDQPVAQGETEVREGRALVRLTNRIDRGGAHLFRFTIHPEEDAHRGNNSRGHWVEAVGEPRILLISAFLDDPLANLLRGTGHRVHLVTDPSVLHAGYLQGARSLILNNVPMDVLPSTFAAEVDFFVRKQGGGFLMTGGAQSFGSGGYHGSALEDLLPVTTELREDHHQLSVALALVLDRSGSMNANVPGSSLRKMDLANSGAARAIEMLGSRDAVTVFAVDTNPHTILPLTQLGGTDRTPLIEMVERIQSAGGGIFVYTGLKAAWEELQMSSQGQRHIILFADAMDAEEPGRYRQLIAEMVSQGVSLSVIGLGRPTDRDADFLRDVAERGKGRIFFSDNANDLPTLFAQETIAVARSMFIEEITATAAVGGWAELSPHRPDWLDAVDAYNLTYLRPEAVASLRTTDDYQAPLIAHTRRGLGRVAAITFPLAGDFSARTRAWPGYGEALPTLIRWLRGEDLPPGIALLTRIDGEILILDLLYGPTWEQRFSREVPQIHLRTAGQAATEIAWERTGPGHFRAQTRLTDNQPVIGATVIGDQAVPFGPLALAHDPEWDFSPARIQELRTLSQATGGEERLQLSSVWDAPRTESLRGFDLYLLIALLGLALADFLHTRMGFKWALIEFGPSPSRPASPQRTRRRPASKLPDPEKAFSTPIPPEAGTQEPMPDSLLSRLQKAKTRSPRDSD